MHKVCIAILFLEATQRVELLFKVFSISVTLPTSPHIFSTSPGIWPWKVESPLRIPATAGQATPWGTVTTVSGGNRADTTLPPFEKPTFRKEGLVLFPSSPLYSIKSILPSLSMAGWSNPPKYTYREIYTSNPPHHVNNPHPCTLVW